MREYTDTPLGVLCRLFGMSRQAYYQHWAHQSVQGYEQQVVVELVSQIRSVHPAIGTRKLHLMIGKELQANRIKMGRDKLYELLSNHGLLLRKRRKRIRTTNSDHPFRKYPNLIIGATIDHPQQVWVSDITYWKVNDSFLYLSFITDVYSKKIVGYKLSKTLEARSSLAALKMAIKISNQDNLAGLIHHSDRGIQYCTHEYTQMLTAYQIQISMTQSGDPLENPIAERLNGIIKNEYLRHYHPINFTEAEVLVASVVDRYNMQRPHLSCNLEVPETIHNSNRSLLGKHNLSTYPRNKQYV